MITVKEALTQFLESRRRRCVPRIVEWYASHLGLFVDWLNERGISGLRTVGERDLENYVAWLRERERFTRKGKLSPVTIQKRVGALRTFFQWAHQTRLIESNPSVWLLAALPRAARRLPKTLKPEDIRALMVAEMDARERAVLSLMLDSGLRLSEVAGLEIGDMDLERGMARVRHGKGDKERWVVFGSETRAVLRAWLSARPSLNGKSGNAVFVGQRGRLSAGGLYKVIKRVAERAGVTLHPHMLRHTFATEYLEAGGSLVDAKELLGHTDIRTTMVYVSVSLERLRAKHEKLSLVNRLKTG